MELHHSCILVDCWSLAPGNPNCLFIKKSIININIFLQRAQMSDFDRYKAMKAKKMVRFNFKCFHEWIIDCTKASSLTCTFNLSTEEQNHQARGEETPEGGSKKVIGSTNKHFEISYPWPSVFVFTNCTIWHGWYTIWICFGWWR